MQAAMATVFPDSPDVRVMFVKGTSNYVDPAQTIARVQAHLGVQHEADHLGEALDSLLGALFGRQNVHRLDQDALPLAAISERLKDWAERVGSVLVGTKSLLTGVDARGLTNTLVIIDRVLRSPGNPVDDARVAEIQDRTGDRWGADRSVYAADASLLLSQDAVAWRDGRRPD